MVGRSRHHILGVEIDLDIGTRHKSWRHFPCLVPLEGRGL